MVKLGFKMFFLVFLLNHLISVSQEKVWIDSSIIKYVDEFIVEGKKRGFDAVPHIVKLDSIKFNQEMPLLTLGLYEFQKNEKDEIFNSNILINEYTKIDWLCLRYTIFHELSHACGYLKHSCYNCDDILTEHTPKNHTYAHYLDEVYWGKKLDIMFKSIKENDENKVK